MCLILLAFRVHPDFAVLLAGNRDEFKQRPSAPPEPWQTVPRIWAGRDLEAGGTWMGRNEAGMMAALTNRRSDAPDPADPLSRGEIVTGLLGHTDPAAAADWVAGLPVKRYRPFNVLFGSVDGFYFFGPQESPHPTVLGPGFHALSNSSLDDRSWPKVARSHAFFERNRGLAGEALLARLRSFLGDATPPDSLPPRPDLSEEIHGAIGAVFIDHGTYGTVSSTIFTAGGGAGERYLFAEGPDLLADPERAFRDIPMV